MHMALHVIVPVVVAWLFFRSNFKQATWLMLAGILIDVDHLFADPIMDPDRCSVGFHFLHSYWIAGIYMLMALIPKTRLLGIGLVIHVVLDALDCMRNNNLW